jgi:hypothetical protein
MPIPSHHAVGDTGHAADHNAIVDTLTGHDQAITNLQGVTANIFYVTGGNVSTIADNTTIWSRVNLPSGDRSAAPDTFQVFHGSNKIFWLDNEGKPRVKNDDPTHIPSVIDSAAGQTANLAEWRVNGVAKASIDANGNLSATNLNKSAWTNISLNSGIVAYGHSTHTPQYRIQGDVVELRGVCGKSNGTDFTSSPVVLGTLPVGARPTALVYNVVARQVSGATMAARLEVATTGAITVYTDTSNSGAWISVDNTSFSILGE